MPLTLTPVTLSSLPTLHTLRLSADPSDPLTSALFPAGASLTSIAHFVKQSEREMRDLGSRSRLMQVVDVGTGEVVCFCKWVFFVRGKVGGEGEMKGETRRDYVEEWPEDARVEAIEGVVGEGRRMREKWMGGRDYALIANLVTSPKHRRKGAASQLISAGLALADAHHLPTYVEATPVGLGLYLKHGFEKVDTLTVDLRPWGHPIVQEHTILIRPAAPASPLSLISISPYLTNADFLDFAKIKAKAFQTSPLSRVLFPPPDPQTPKDPARKNPTEIRAASLVEKAISDPSVRLVKAFIPETQQIIGWAKWNFYLDPTNPSPESPITWPPGANLALKEHFKKALYKPRNSHMRGKAYFFMRFLAVLPDYQRQGVGKKMLEWGLKQADELGVECWIDATPAGLGLYKKFGWEEVNVVTIDLEPYGGNPGEKEVNVQLIRPPQPPEAWARVS